MGKEKLIPILAMSVLLIGISSAIYVQATQVDKDTISINGHEYTIDQLFSMGAMRTIKTDEGEKMGLALDDLMSKVGLGCLSCHSYVIKAKDRYQQTISWDIMQTGILTDYSRVYFPDTAHTFWIRDVVEIEVK
jgi:hypothetical protein